MSETSAAKPFDQIVSRLKSAGTILAVTHARPDGDGLGSMAALAGAARGAGKTLHMLVPDKIPFRYDFLFEGSKPATFAEFAAMAAAADALVVLDTCALAQLGELTEGIAGHRHKVLVLDHHATGDNVGEVQWVDPSAAATGVMVGELLEALGWPLDVQVAEALLTAVTSDTGWLRFANTDARCLHAAAKWLDAGVRPDKLYMRLYQADRPERLRLMARMLQSFELHCQGRLAVMAIRRADFQASGALPEETENLVNEALRIGTVETAVLLVETDGAIRVSLRSRDAVNVATIAQAFGGGGHARAAGVRVAGDLDELKVRLIAACGEALKKQLTMDNG